MWGGLVYSAIDTYLLAGKAPWTFGHHADHKQLNPAAKHSVIRYPKPDGKNTFDRLSSVFLSATAHEENQPCHLRLTDEDVPLQSNLALYDGPEARYCPASVYEFISGEDGQTKLQINN